MDTPLSDEELRAQREEVKKRQEFETIMEKVPERYRDLVPLIPKHPYIKVSEERWTEVIQSIRVHINGPIDRGVILFGPPSVGKTTLLASIFRRYAANHAKGIHRYSLEWLDMGVWANQITNWNSLPTFSIERLQHLSTPVHLFMDEFDKIPATEYRQGAMNTFVRLAYAKKCPMFIATNMTLLEYKKMDQHVARRIGEDGRSLHIDLYNTGLKKS